MSETKKELEGSILVFTKKESIGWSFYIEKENDTEFEFSFEDYQMLAKLFTDALQTIQRDPLHRMPSELLDDVLHNMNLAIERGQLINQKDKTITELREALRKVQDWIISMENGESMLIAIANIKSEAETILLKTFELPSNP